MRVSVCIYARPRESARPGRGRLQSRIYVADFRLVTINRGQTAGGTFKQQTASSRDIAYLMCTKIAPI